MLSICNLSRRFNQQQVLDGVSLQVDPTEILGLVGPNGAGKSTLLRCVIGLVRPDQGTIQVGAVDALTHSLEARSLIGYGPSETALYHRMRAGELLEFALSFHESADLDEGRALLQRFEVPVRRRVRHLSHGMKRKILLAQALASGAGLLLLDEPMEALEPEARRMGERLLRARARDGAAVLFSSHDLASTERLCDRIAFLHQGAIIREGRAAELQSAASSVLRLTLREPVSVGSLPTHKGWVWQGERTSWTLRHEDAIEVTLGRLQHLPIAGINDGSESLEDLFAALCPGGGS